VDSRARAELIAKYALGVDASRLQGTLPFPKAARCPPLALIFENQPDSKKKRNKNGPLGPLLFYLLIKLIRLLSLFLRFVIL